MKYRVVLANADGTKGGDATVEAPDAETAKSLALAEAAASSETPEDVTPPTLPEGVETPKPLGAPSALTEVVEVYALVE